MQTSISYLSMLMIIGNGMRGLKTDTSDRTLGGNFVDPGTAPLAQPRLYRPLVVTVEQPVGCVSM